MIFDTHAHYDDEAFDENRFEMLESMQENGIGHIVDVCASVGHFDRVYDLVEKYPFVYGAVGVHPDDADKVDAAVPCFFKGMEETIAAPDANDLQKVKEILLKQAGVDEKNNAYWLGVIANYTGIGFDNYTGYKEFVKNLRGEQVSDFLKNVLLKSGNHVEVIMKAEKSKE